ncbi:MAG: 23S rRNA (guanosine(2251)-2'-O)-methyltransferase RlmB [Firmicutes bacterium]|nr:23S rRNA (guanosine(2251)-2'-O)-methyltransferase RlmB [Bacillota bacterium]
MNDRFRRTDPGREDVVEGRQPVLEALRSGRGRIHKILVATGAAPGLGSLVHLALEMGIPVQQVERKSLDALSPSGSHQGVLALAAARDYVDLEEVVARSRDSSHPPLVIIADGVEDPRNLGALLRVAGAVGAGGVIIPKRRAAGLTSAVARASAGALEYIGVARVPNLASVLEELKGKGFWIVGMDSSQGVAPWEVDLTVPVAMVVGGEGRGLRRLLAEKCDFLVRLPMLGRLSSLNVVTAVAAVAYEAVRQRHAMNQGGPHQEN